MQTLNKAANGKFKVTLRSFHVAAVLELCKVQNYTYVILWPMIGDKLEINAFLANQCFGYPRKKFYLLAKEVYLCC